MSHPKLQRRHSTPIGNALIAARRIIKQSHDLTEPVDTSLYIEKNYANNSTLESDLPSIYAEDLFDTPIESVSRAQKTLANANGNWRRFFLAASKSSASHGSKIFEQQVTSLDNKLDIQQHAPLLMELSRRMHAHLDFLIGKAWDSRPERKQAAHEVVSNIVKYAHNWGERAEDGTISLSYIQMACGLSRNIISDSAIERPALNKLTTAIARCAALDVLKMYLVSKINGYNSVLETGQIKDKRVSQHTLATIKSKLETATATTLLLDRAIDIARMKVHTFKGIELAQSLANLKQSIIARLISGNIPPAMHNDATQSIHIINLAIVGAASATLPLSNNCTTNIVHGNASQLEKINFCAGHIKRRLADDAMAYGYTALAMQLDAKDYEPSQRPSERATNFGASLNSQLPTDLMALR